MKGDGPKGDRPTHVEDGCNLYFTCFECPFTPDCKIRDRDVLKTPKVEEEAHQLKREGYTQEQIAKELRQSIRTVARWLKV